MSSDNCPFGETECADGRCIKFATLYKCPEEKCFGDSIECNNKIQCYLKTFHYCDGANDCEDGTDEIGCDELVSVGASKGDSNVFVIAVVVAVTLVVIIAIAIIVFRSRRGRQGRVLYRNTATTTVVPPVQNYGPSSQPLIIQVQQPAYYPPGPPAQAPVGPSQPRVHGAPTGPFQPAVHGAPAGPFQPAPTGPFQPAPTGPFQPGPFQPGPCQPMHRQEASAPPPPMAVDFATNEKMTPPPPSYSEAAYYPPKQ